MLIIILFFFSIKNYSQNKPDDILGRWYTPNNESIVEIYKKNNKYFGKLTWVKKPYDENGKLLTDIKNPDEKLRSRPFTGMEFMFGFEFDGIETWRKGKIYNAQDGRTYDAYLKLNDINTLKVRGYIGYEWIGGNSIWIRVKG